ncbi:hypothetical protein CTAYLR_009595 [Chrysophaeum taylorii]|uniref:Protein kinase domain-containing protein n=1 Tax=Chrysophaeum taylorii TaxID=2483200 RepID=A0AAD7XRY2_9STRA|nr:hypothetical protein CTAYLR_009595 [Chrysophaeum taylorii]
MTAGAPAPSGDDPPARSRPSTDTLDETPRWRRGDSTSGDNNNNSRPSYYRKGDIIGRGASGVVYQGMDTHTGSLVAIKEVPAQRGDPSFHKLVQEVQLMSRLSHEHIVAYYGAELDDEAGVLLIYQEWVPGGSIDSLLHKFGGRFPDVVARRYAIDVAKGLAYLHREKIVHRDIKGANVLVSDQGVAKLSDFGTSMMLADNTTAAGAKTLCGTPYYMAPEVMKGETYGRKADIWSFGGLLLQMATGSPPWKCMNFQSIPQLLIHVITFDRPPPLDSYDLGPDLKALILRCFEFDPSRRPTAAELIEDPFLALGDNDDTPQHHRPDPDRSSSPPPARPTRRVGATAPTPPRRGENPYSRSAARSRSGTTSSSSESPSNRRDQQRQPAPRLSENRPSPVATRPRLHVTTQRGGDIDVSSSSLSPGMRTGTRRPPSSATSPRGATGSTSPKPPRMPHHHSASPRRGGQTTSISPPTQQRHQQNGVMSSPPPPPPPASHRRRRQMSEADQRAQENEAFDQLVRTLPDDDRAANDNAASASTTTTTTLGKRRPQPTVPPPADDVHQMPTRRSPALESPVIAAPGRRQRSTDGDTTRESLGSEAAEAYAESIPANEKFLDDSTDTDGGVVIPIEVAYEQGLLSAKEYKTRMERFRLGDEDAVNYNVIYPR